MLPSKARDSDRAPVVQIPPFSPDQSLARSSHGQHGLGFRTLKAEGIGMAVYPNFKSDMSKMLHLKK